MFEGEVSLNVDRGGGVRKIRTRQTTTKVALAGEPRGATQESFSSPSVAEVDGASIPEEGGATRQACSGVSLASHLSLFQERNKEEEINNRTC